MANTIQKLPRPRTATQLTEAEVLERYPDLQAVRDSLRPMVTIAEAAEALRRSVTTVRGYTRSGKLKTASGRYESVRISRAEVLRLLARDMEP